MFTPGRSPRRLRRGDPLRRWQPLRAGQPAAVRSARVLGWPLHPRGRPPPLRRRAPVRAHRRCLRAHGGRRRTVRAVDQRPARVRRGPRLRRPALHPHGPSGRPVLTGRSAGGLPRAAHLRGLRVLQPSDGGAALHLASGLRAAAAMQPRDHLPGSGRAPGAVPRGGAALRRRPRVQRRSLRPGVPDRDALSRRRRWRLHRWPPVRLAPRRTGRVLHHRRLMRRRLPHRVGVPRRGVRRRRPVRSLGRDPSALRRGALLRGGRRWLRLVRRRRRARRAVPDGSVGPLRRRVDLRRRPLRPAAGRRRGVPGHPRSLRRLRAGPRVLAAERMRPGEPELQVAGEQQPRRHLPRRCARRNPPRRLPSLP